MQEIPALITDLTIILVVAALTTLLCKKINLPSVLGYILAGFLAGPVVQFLPTIEDLGGIEVWSDIGVIFLMFGLGLEFSVHKMAEVGVPGFLSAGVQAVGMGAVGVLVGLALGWGTMNSVFLGVMLAMSSTMITMKSIEDLGLKKEPFANLAMGTLVIEDIIAIFAMVILSTIAVSQSISGFALAERIGLLLLYLALWLILGIYLVPTVMKKLVGLMNDEVLLVFSLGLCFLMAVLAEEIGLSTELGAFLAGSLLAGTVHAVRVEHLVTPCKHLFGAGFFLADPGGGVLLHHRRSGPVPVRHGGVSLPHHRGRLRPHDLHHALPPQALPAHGALSANPPPPKMAGRHRALVPGP